MYIYCIAYKYHFTNLQDLQIPINKRSDFEEYKNLENVGKSMRNG